MIVRAASAALLSLLSLTAAVSAQTYTLVPLGRADGFTAYPRRINDAGAIAGHVAMSGASSTYPAVWTDGGVVRLDYEFQYATATSINDSGEVVGTLQRFDRTGLVSHAALWSGGLRPFLEPAATLGYAVDINDAGEVCGTYQVPGTWQTFPYRWSASVVTTLPMLEGTTQINPLAMNNDGDVVGFGVVSGVVTPLQWKGSSIEPLPFSGYSAVANDVNDAGVAVGVAAMRTPTGGYVPQAVRWDASGMTYLASLGGLSSRALAINSAGEIVGVASSAGAHFPALWSGGTVIDLQAAAGDTGGCTVIEPVSINDLGQIAVRLSCPGDSLGQYSVGRLDPLARSPEDRLAGLIASLESAVADAAVAQSFRAKIDAALASLERGSSAAACNQLDALANAVEAQSGKALSSADAAAALKEIAAISEQLGC